MTSASTSSRSLRSGLGSLRPGWAACAVVVLAACGGQSASDAERNANDVKASNEDDADDDETAPGQEQPVEVPLTSPFSPIAGPTVPLTEEQFDAAVTEQGAATVDEEFTPEGTTTLIDEAGSAWRMIDVPAAGNEPKLVATPEGWFALSRRNMGMGKVIGEWQSVLYRSTDGVHWASVPFAPDRSDLSVTDITYGDGRYVMTASARDGVFEGLFFVSENGEDWEEVTAPVVDQAQYMGVLGFAEGKFFAFGFRVLAVSEDAHTWTLMGSDLVQFGSAAYGNGHYVLAGNGPMLVSEDGFAWASHNVDCSIPGACITDPSGNVGQSYQDHLEFADGYFYSDQMRSEDGVTWEALPGRVPAAFDGGRFIGGFGYSLNTWTPSSDPEPLHVIRPSQAAVTAHGRSIVSVGVLDFDAPLPNHVSVEFEDDLTCETASCVIVDSRMYLVPPVGTPPLRDRIPRDAEGNALLSDECPYSAMLRCDDYEARTGCTCDEEAPANPNHCQDVSQFQCAGEFEAWPDEWPLAEISDGGCDCNAIDPNQPPTFGNDCEEGSDACAAPLSCLAIDYPPSYGGPAPQQPYACTTECGTDADCPSWDATGYCAGSVKLRCSNGTCQPRECE